jgi:hypothetical protein
MRTRAAIVLIVLVAPPLAPAQDVSETPEGVICRQPECNIQRSLPLHVNTPADAEPLFIERVKNTLASTLEAGLPAIPFDLWLLETLRVHSSRAGDDSFAAWSLTLCDERASAAPRAGPDWCVEARVPVSEGRIVKIMVRVTSWASVSGLPEWRVIQPVVHDIFIEREEDLRTLDSLDVTALRQIQDRLRLPFGEWPIVNLTNAVAWFPHQPRPGEVVRFTFSVTNIGGRDADRAEVTIYIAVPLDNNDLNDLKEIRRSWFPRIPAGKSVSLDISVKLGRGDATIVVQSGPKEGFKRMRPVNADDNEVVAQIPLIR